MHILKILPIILIIFISGCTAQVNETTGNNTTGEQQGTQPPEATTPTQPSGGELEGTVLPPFPTEG